MPAVVVATYNVHGGVDGWGRPFDVVDACRRIDADVLVLQECWTPEGGVSTAERVAGALHRVAAVLAERQVLAEGPAGQPGTTTGLAVVVSHGAALRLGMSWLLGMPDELFSVLGPLSNCSWSVLGRRHDRWRLLEHNAGTLPEPILSDDR